MDPIKETNVCHRGRKESVIMLKKAVEMRIRGVEVLEAEGAGSGCCTWAGGTV